MATDRVAGFLQNFGQRLAKRRTDRLATKQGFESYALSQSTSLSDTSAWLLRSMAVIRLFDAIRQKKVG